MNADASSNDAGPRMSADEADARFAALVAQYRQEQKPRRARARRAVDPAAVAFFVYVIGVTIGASWHDHVGRALVLGGVGVVAFALWRRFSPSGE